MACAQDPPEVNMALLKTKDLKGKSISWENIELPIDFLLLTVKECEFLSSLSFLNRGFTKSYHKRVGYVYFGYIGEYEAKKLKIALIKCNSGSAGPGGSSVVVKNVVGALRPKAVISVGYCASLNHQNAKLGDVVVSANLTTYAAAKIQENGDIEELGHSVPPKKHLSDLIKSVDEGWEAPLKNPGELDVKVDRDGVFLSGPEEVQSKRRCSQLRKRFPNAVAIEMEGEGLYAAAYDLDIEWIIIKGISEYAHSSSPPADSWRQFASVMAASVTAHMLKDPIVFQKWRHYGGHCSQTRLLKQTTTAVPPREALVPVTNNARGFPATSSSSVLKRRGEFLSTESPEKTSKLLPSNCASNAEQSVVSSSRTADESPPKPSKLLPSSCASNAEQSLVSSSRTADGSPATSSSSVLKREGEFLSTESPPKTSQKLLPSSCASNAEQSVVSNSRTPDDLIKGGITENNVSIEELSSLMLAHPLLRVESDLQSPANSLV